MSERKVINKWLDPEFDPSKVVVEKKLQKTSCGIRMMLPMTVSCLNCGNYMGIGTKFNMRLETVLDEDYLGIKIYRFYFKCTKCFVEVTFKTDPKNHDYVCEWGLKKKPQYWKDIELAEEEYKSAKAKEMKDDAMKSLEYKKEDTKIEMDILDAIDQVKSLNKKLGVLNVEDTIIEIIQNNKKQKEKEIERQQEILNTDNTNELLDERISNLLKNKRIQDFSDKVVKSKSSINKFINKNSFVNCDEDSDE